MSGRKRRKGVGRAGFLRRQPAKVVSFQVLAVPLLRDHLVLVAEDLAAGGGRWSGKECALWVRGGCAFPLPAPQLQEFSLESNKGGAAHHVAATPLDFLFRVWYTQQLKRVAQGESDFFFSLYFFFFILKSCQSKVILMRMARFD